MKFNIQNYTVSKSRRGAPIPDSPHWLLFVSVFLWMASFEIFFPQFSIAIHILIIYGFAALFFNLPSIESFRMTILCFCIIVIATAIDQDRLVETFTVYGFVLLGIGLLCTIKEGSRLKKSINPYLEEMDELSDMRTLSIEQSKRTQLQHKQDPSGLRELGIHDTISRSGDKDEPRLRRGIQ